MALPHSYAEHLYEVGRASPSLTVAGLSMAGVSLSDWVLLATLVYTLLQTGWFVYSKFIRKNDEPRI